MRYKPFQRVLTRPNTDSCWHTHIVDMQYEENGVQVVRLINGDVIRMGVNSGQYIQPYNSNTEYLHGTRLSADGIKANSIERCKTCVYAVTISGDMCRCGYGNYDTFITDSARCENSSKGALPSGDTINRKTVDRILSDTLDSADKLTPAKKALAYEIVESIRKKVGEL